MMAAPSRVLKDDDARRSAVGVHDRCFLVEAGAGSGKTAVLAGRIAMLLSEGIAPSSIAALTFTEFAASELLIRVREFVGALTRGEVPIPLGVALPHGLSENQRDHLVDASEALDDITCSTIHGFCQRLIAPYPVEADIDPGATVMDRDQADLAFREITDAWLRENLTDEVGGLLAELVICNPDGTVGLIRAILDHLRSHRDIVHEAPEDIAPLASAFVESVNRFDAFVSEADAQEPESASIANQFRELGEAVQSCLPARTPADLVALLLTLPHPDLLTKAGAFFAYRKKGKWVAAARRSGLSQADGDQLNRAATAHYVRCCEAWTTVQQTVASHVLGEFIPLVRPVMDRFRDHKRSAALLDFDDLIFAARDLLRDHDVVRQALAARFTHVLVDEFQDTDPLQTEIFWRLCGDPPAERSDTDWTTFTLRPGALFLVGDPKQAIYRFRGADIRAYVRAREAFRAQSADGVISISTNFRSRAPIMGYVNDRFQSVLSEENGQPGFQALDPFHPDCADGPSVAALDIEVADDDGKANQRQQRDGEAEAIAEMCARLIGSLAIRDPESGEQRACRAGDIALLAPTGSDLWRYEEALERRGIPVATQAGKGLFQRQEIQDLIALTRVLADHRDTLALGSLLRGPLVGLTEEELLDIVWSLPRRDEAPNKIPHIDLHVVPDAVVHDYARDVIERLQALRSKVNTTAPHALLAQAIDVLRVRPILLQRHRGQAERALANVDLFLSFSRAYSVRGLRAFAEAMTAAWSEEARAVEGRPDAQEESVALYTMHAAKGLEWPIVVPINTMTRRKSTDTAVTVREGNRFYCSVLGVEPRGYAAARENEKGEVDRERVRLWYVAVTRARELLVLPRLDVAAARTAWLSIVDLGLPDLTPLDLVSHSPEVDVVNVGPENQQTREDFATEAAAIEASQRKILWRVPSRDEGAAGAVFREEVQAVHVTDGDGAPAEVGQATTIQGGRDRGIVLHKLLEEVLTGETAETIPALVARAEDLVLALGSTAVHDPALGLAPAELADCVVRALSLPEVVALRPHLVPEFPLYMSTVTEAHEEVTTGIADAIAFDSDGVARAVIDWKSDVNLVPEKIQHYRAQMRAYLDVTGAERGLIVALTSGTVISVT